MRPQPTRASRPDLIVLSPRVRVLTPTPFHPANSSVPGLRSPARNQPTHATKLETRFRQAELERIKSQLAMESNRELEVLKLAVSNANWPEALRQELQKTRSIERQEFRIKSYGALWSKLRVLAIYDRKIINRSTALRLSEDLSDWYFLESGGLLLTPFVRDFYFALQDLLRAIAKEDVQWTIDRTTADPRGVFEKVLDAHGLVQTKQVFD